MGLASSPRTHLLLVRSEPQVPPTLEGWGRHKGVGTIPGLLQGLSLQFLILFVDLLSS